MDTTMEDKLMHVQNDDKQNTPFCRVKVLIEKFKHCKFEPTNQNLIKVNKVFKPTNKKNFFIKIYLPV